jgi:hypothetical protein
MAGNDNFDALLSTTLDNYRPRLEDNVFTARPLTYWLNSKDRIRKEPGGAKIVVPVMYAQNSTAGSYSGYDTIDITPQEGISAAQYDWKQYGATVAINGLEEAQNRGEAQIINLLESKIMQAEETIAEQMDEMLFSDGTGNSGKDFLGLEHFVSDDPTTGVVGGIDRSDGDNAWWRNHVNDDAVDLDLGDMGNAYNSVSRGNDSPDFIITTQELFEAYEALLNPHLRFTDSKTADGGFQNLLFKTAPVVFDVYTPAGVVYFLNSKYIKLTAHSDVWFKTTPFVKPNNQDARYSQILCYGNLVVSNCSRLGKLANRTAA